MSRLLQERKPMARTFYLSDKETELVNAAPQDSLGLGRLIVAIALAVLLVYEMVEFMVLADKEATDAIMGTD